MTLAARLHEAASRIGPEVVGVVIGRPQDRATWEIQFAVDPTDAEAASAADLIATFPTEVPLAEHRAAASAAVQAAAVARVDAITQPWYASKFAQAVYATDGDAAAIAALTPEAQARGLSVADLAASIIAKHDAWELALNGISLATTTGKAAIAAGQSVAAIDAARDAAVATIDATGDGA